MLPIGLRLRLPGVAASMSVESARRPAAIALQELLQGILEWMRQSFARKDKARLGLLQFSGVHRSRQLQTQTR